MRRPHHDKRTSSLPHHLASPTPTPTDHSHHYLKGKIHTALEQIRHAIMMNGHHKKPYLKFNNNIPTTITGRRHKTRRRLSFIFKIAVSLLLLRWVWYWGAPSSSTSNEISSNEVSDGIPPLVHHIPLGMISTHDWPVMLRLFRWNNRVLTSTARAAMEEYGNELRSLVAQGRPYLSIGSNAQESETATSSEALQFRKRLQQRAPWLKGDAEQPGWPLSQLPTPSVGQALVISAGDGQLNYLKALLYAIRVVHASTISVRIVFKDQHDLTPPARQELLTYLEQQSASSSSSSSLTTKITDNIEFMDLSDYFDMDAAQIKGWNLKPYGLLAVPETQVAFLDVDVLLLKPPEELFQSQGFQQTGALFFHDRLKPELGWNPREFLAAMQPNPSIQAQNLLKHGSFYTEHIQEAGVILVDKQRRSLGLWTACLLVGRRDIRMQAQRDYFYGDKEFYWMSFEAVQEPYEFARFYPGVVGGILTDFHGGDLEATVKDNNSVKELDTKTNDLALCGRMLHFDDNGEPLWSNGGYLTKEEEYASKSSDMSEIELQPVWYLDGGDTTTEDFSTVHPILWYTVYNMKGMNQNWKVHSGIGVECISPNARQLRRIPHGMASSALQTVENYIDLIRARPRT